MIESRNTRRVLKLIGIITLLLVAFYYFVIAHSYYTIDIRSSDTSTPTQVLHADNNGGTKSPASLFGIYMVPRGSQTLVIKQANRETRQLITDKLPLGFNHALVTLKQQLAVSKIGQGGLGCNGKTSDSRFFTYSCFDASSEVFLYADKKSGQYTNQPVTVVSATQRTINKTYKDGLLFTTSESSVPSLRYVDVSTGKTQNVLLADQISDAINIYTSSNDESFLVADNKSHLISVYKSLTDAPRTFNIPKGLTYSSCDVSSKYFVCAATPEEVLRNNEEGSHDAANQELIEDSRIIRYDLSTNKQETLESTRLMDTLCFTQKGIYTIEDDNKLYIYPVESKRQSLVATDISSISCSDAKVLFTNGESVYSLGSESAELMFKEKRLRVSTLWSNPSDNLFNTYTDEQNSTLHTYRLTDKEAPKNRAEGTLPYAIDSELPILEMDYDDDTIYIKPRVSISSDSETGTTTIDEDALAQTKRTIEAKLQADGLLDRYKIVYYLRG